MQLTQTQRYCIAAKVKRLCKFSDPDVIDYIDYHTTDKRLISYAKLYENPEALKECVLVNSANFYKFNTSKK